jgi:hypothetical protein
VFSCGDRCHTAIVSKRLTKADWNPNLPARELAADSTAGSVPSQPIHCGHLAMLWDCSHANCISTCSRFSSKPNDGPRKTSIARGRAEVKEGWALGLLVLGRVGFGPLRPDNGIRLLIKAISADSARLYHNAEPVLQVRNIAQKDTITVGSYRWDLSTRRDAERKLRPSRLRPSASIF